MYVCYCSGDLAQWKGDFVATCTFKNLKNKAEGPILELASLIFIPY